MTYSFRYALVPVVRRVKENGRTKHYGGLVRFRGQPFVVECAGNPYSNAIDPKIDAEEMLRCPDGSELAERLEAIVKNYKSKG